MNQTHVNQTKTHLAMNFTADTRPWVIAYSGGKDSTLTLQLVYELLLSLPVEKRKPVHIVSSDTRVESPNIENYLKTSLEQIQTHAEAENLNIHTHLVEPSVEQSFWGNVIGKGYPAPTRWFRWCTSKMKIKPVRAVIENIVNHSDSGSVILLIGTRAAESTNRARHMNKRTLSSRGLNQHPEIQNTLVSQPIADWSTDQVWEYLCENNPSPWGCSHDFMLQLYREASSGECPVVMDMNTPSCGGSRFGCWTCTVVNDDKSMKGFIQAGNEGYELLYNFRAWLKEIREDPKFRNVYRRNGSAGNGPFNSATRKLILEKLLQAERDFSQFYPGKHLITDEELLFIQQEWTKDFDIANSALRIAHRYQRQPKKTQSDDSRKRNATSIYQETVA